jgi:hypothetical protein
MSAQPDIRVSRIHGRSYGLAAGDLDTQICHFRQKQPISLLAHVACLQLFKHARQGRMPSTCEAALVEILNSTRGYAPDNILALFPRGSGR